MSERINPSQVPHVTLASGERVPCIGMGTFGSDRYSPAEVASAVSGAIRYGYRFFD
jgi:diketogulonate reductase-like aldo/keto reductase